MTQRDRWAHRSVVDRYYTFCDELRLKHPQKLSPQLKAVIFYLPLPKSWSKKRKTEMLGKPHQVKPDIDNLLKAVMDALCENDSYIYEVQYLGKFWSETPGIEIVNIT